MASNNKSVVFPALLFLAVALVLTAASVRAQSPAPPPSSQNPCPSGFTNSTTFFQAMGTYLLRGISLILVLNPVAPGTSTTFCYCYPTTSITIGPIVVPNTNGPLTCVQGPI
ncbi:unnamed protein product [Miscanthus lutarioriparius]|uniref:Uncharacterized protein n=1 Tax=Miscanthus lutarioriparius TaxID=422564 RepID=A0A811Q6W6_9POAL|nr:unnamed protein product [Miscanthus lutarioriparius]